jgi:predicted peptidase
MFWNVSDRRAVVVGLVIIGLMVWSGCGADAAGLPAGPSSERMTLRPAGSVEGSPRGYVEYLPPGYGDGEARPLLVFLHALGVNGSGSETALNLVLEHGLPPLIKNDEWPQERPFIVLMPQNHHVDDCPTAGEVESFVDFAIQHYDVDEGRVYLTGMSCGAVGAWDYLAADGRDVIAAAVLISAPAVFAFEQTGCELGRVPTWSFHGDADEVVPLDAVEEPINQLKACTDPDPADVRLTVYPGVGHEAWLGTYDLAAGHDIYAWLLEHENT